MQFFCNLKFSGAQHRSEIEMSLSESGIAPPMSLSAPELGSGEPLEMPLMRDAVSSTELLHERAMARFYQAAADEESQKLLKRRYSTERKSVERRISLKDGVLERRHSFKDGTHTEKPKAEDKIEEEKVEEEVEKENILLPNKIASVKEKSPEIKVSKIPVKKAGIKPEESKTTEIKEPLEEINISAIPRLKKEGAPPPEAKPKAILRKEERLSSVEREQLEFALVRDRIRQKNEQNLQPRVLPPRPPNLQQQSSSQKSSFDKEEEMEEEYAEDVEEEEDYLEDEEIEDEEEEEEVDVEEPKEELTLNDAKYRPKALGLQTPPPVPKHGIPKKSPEKEVKTRKQLERMAPYAEEEDTYHPRSMIPTRSVFPKFETPLPVTVESPDEIKSEKQEKPEIIIKVEPPEETKPETAAVATIAPSPPPPEPVKMEVPQKVTESAEPIKKPEAVSVDSKEITKETPSKIPVPPEKPPKKKTQIFKKIEKLTLKRDKKVPAVTSLIVDSTIPMASVASVVLPKPILKKKSKKEKESAKESNKSKSKESVDADELDDDDPSNKKKKQVRIAEPREAGDDLKLPTSNDPKLSPNTARRQQKIQRRQQSLEEDEQGNKVLIYHYSDIVREYGSAKKPPPKLYLDYEELKAHAPEEEVKVNEENISPRPAESEAGANGSDKEERGSALDMSQVDNGNEASNAETEKGKEKENSVEPPVAVEAESSPTKTPSPEPEEPASLRSSAERTHSPSPEVLRPLSPEEKVRTSMEYMTDVAMFIVACWLYLFKNELYAIPVLCLMVYRQMTNSLMETYQNVKESIMNKIPERFRKKSKEGEGEDEVANGDQEAENDGKDD